MPKSRGTRPKPRSATKQTTAARKRSTFGQTAAEKVKAAEAEAGRAALPDGAVPQGEPAAVGVKDAPGEMAGAIVGAAPPAKRHVVGGAEHATTASGADHPSVDAKTPKDAGERFQAIVGPPESASPTAALDTAVRAATKNDDKAVWDNLPAGVIIESLGPVHGYRATGPGMHRPTGNGRTPIDAVKNIGVPLIRDEELPDDQKSAARKAQEAKEAVAREAATPAVASRAPAAA